MPWSAPGLSQKSYSPASGLTHAIVAFLCVTVSIILALGFQPGFIENMVAVSCNDYHTISFPNPSLVLQLLLGQHTEAMNSSPLHPHTQTPTLHSMAPALSQSSWVGVCHSSVHFIKRNHRPGRVFQGLPSTKAQVIHHRAWRSTVFPWRRSKDPALGHVPPFASQGLTRLPKDPGTSSLPPSQPVVLWPVVGTRTV